MAAERTALGAEALKHLTAAEQAELFAAAPATVARTSSELYAAAVANVAAAFAARDPAPLLVRAQRRPGARRGRRALPHRRASKK